jgi:hypothetical protein
MSPRRVAVLRFDRDPLVCRSRVRDLRALNPGVEIHGLYGGALRLPAGGRAALARFIGLDSVHASSHEGRWNWRHGDLALMEWHREVGRHLDFDVLHLVEWDLVCVAPLAEVWSRVPADAVGLTCLTPTADLQGRWTWLDSAESLAEWRNLLDHARARWGEVPEPTLACLGVGPCFPRAFLDAYAALPPTEACHDELRLPLAAGCLGFAVVDTGFRSSWFATEDDPFFNVGREPVARSTLEHERTRPGGRRAFHPVRERLRLSRRGS